jgi:hypothetical protein
MLRDAVDRLRRASEKHPKMMAVGLRLRLAESLDQITGLSDLWTCCCIETAPHWLTHNPYSKPEGKASEKI